MDARQTTQSYLDRLNATTSDAKRRAAAEFHAFFNILSAEEKRKAKLLFKPRLDALKERIAKVEEKVEAFFQRRLQTEE